MVKFGSWPGSLIPNVMKVVHNIPRKWQKDSGELSGPTDAPETFFNGLKSGEALERRRKQAAIVGELLDFKRAKSQKQHELSHLFFFIGLAVSLAIVIVAFEWRFYDSGDRIELSDLSGDQFEDLLEIPPTDQPPPPPPQQNQQVVIVEISDEVELEELELNLDVEITEDMRISDPAPVLDELPEEEAEEVFLIVENKPEPVGGLPAFYEYLGKNLKYPTLARQMNISGRVYLQFIVEKDGTISNIEVVKGIGGGCDEEAVRVLAGAPAWNPGKQRGVPVKVRMTIPIHFNLSSR